MSSCAQMCVYMRARMYVSLCFNLCCFCCFVAYHGVTAACMSVPVWGHHTNTMNVDTVQSSPYKGNVSAQSCCVTHYLNGQMTGLPCRFWIYRQMRRQLLIICLAIINIVKDWNKTSLICVNNRGRGRNMVADTADGSLLKGQQELCCQRIRG